MIIRYDYLFLFHYFYLLLIIFSFICYLKTRIAKDDFDRPILLLKIVIKDLFLYLLLRVHYDDEHHHYITHFWNSKVCLLQVFVYTFFSIYILFQFYLRIKIYIFIIKRNFDNKKKHTHKITKNTNLTNFEHFSLISTIKLIKKMKK